MEKVAALQSEITELDTSIGVHYRAALNGGWTADELASANLIVPKSATRKRAAKPRTHAEDSTFSAPSTSAQPPENASQTRVIEDIRVLTR